MTPVQCMRLLGLGESASVEEIKRAYRRLAHLLHPDKHGGDESARHRFIETSNAYRTLIQLARTVEAGKRVGLCYGCREFTEVFQSPDGHARCLRCALRTVRSRALPMPSPVVVRCLVAGLFIGVAFCLLVSAILSGRMACAAAGAVSGLLGLAALAHTCLTVVYCIRPEDRAAASIVRQRNRA